MSDWNKHPWDEPHEITCSKCGRTLILEKDLDDWNRPKSYYRDFDGHVDRRHTCFTMHCFRCGKSVDKWKRLEIWDGSSIGLQRAGRHSDISLCIACWDSWFKDWL